MIYFLWQVYDLGQVVRGRFMWRELHFLIWGDLQYGASYLSLSFYWGELSLVRVVLIPD